MAALFIRPAGHGDCRGGGFSGPKGAAGTKTKTHRFLIFVIVISPRPRLEMKPREDTRRCPRKSAATKRGSDSKNVNDLRRALGWGLERSRAVPNDQRCCDGSGLRQHGDS